MDKLEYTKNEKDFIDMWGAKEELNFDTIRVLHSPVSGKKITSLDSAKARKQAVKEIEKLKASLNQSN